MPNFILPMHYLFYCFFFLANPRPKCKFVISRPVRQPLLDLVQQALLDLKQYRGITIEKKKNNVRYI